MDSSPTISTAQVDDQSQQTESADILNKQTQQNENYQKQLRMLQAEEKGLNSILLELRSHSRKLNIEKYRLLNLVKEKQEKEEEEEVNPAPQEQQQALSLDYSAFQF